MNVNMTQSETIETRLLATFGPGIQRFLGIANIQEAQRAFWSKSYQRHQFELHQQTEMDKLYQQMKNDRSSVPRSRRNVK
jgi:hypothetical protein